MDRSGTSPADHPPAVPARQIDRGLRFDPPILCPTLIGRNAHLERLDRLARAARNGHGSTLLIAGEAGIGKSRLVAEARAQTGMRVIQGHCFEPDRRLPFAPILDLLRSLFARVRPERIADLLGPTAPDIVKLVPELESIVPQVQPISQLEPHQEKHRLMRSMSSLLARLAAAAPTLIVIEDIHWSDTTSLEFLLHLARSVPEWPALLLLTFRSDETHTELNHFLASLDRERLAGESTLERLDLNQVELMLQEMFGQYRPVRSDFLQAMWQLTEGNPFFIEEVSKSLVAGGDIFLNDGVWDRKALNELKIPRSIHDAVQQRLVPLSPEAHRVLTLAAVAGRRFDFALLQEISGYGEQRFLSLIKELIAAQLVVEESADRFAFRHALTRQAIYADLLVRERKSLHGTIASALERLYADRRDSRLADLAYHFYEGDNWEGALEYARRAGENAHDLYSPHAAIEHFSHALDAARHLGMAAPVDMLRRRGQVYEWVGAFDHARQDYETVLDDAVASNDRRQEWQALINLGMLWSGRDYERSGHYFRRAQESARLIGDPTLLAHSLNRVGNWYLRVEATRDARRSHRRAQEIFGALGDRRGIAQSLTLLGMAHHVNGNLRKAYESLNDAAMRFREIDDRQGLVFSLATMAVQGPAYHSDTASAAIGLVQAVRDGEAAVEIARDIGWRAGEAYALLRLGCCLGAMGSYGRAIDALTEGLRIAEEIEHRQWMAAAGCSLGALYLDLLDGSAARRALVPALDLGREIGSRYWFRAASGYLANGCILDGDLHEASAALEQGFSTGMGLETLAQRLVWYTRAELALAQDDPAVAMESAERLSTTAGNGHVLPRLGLLRGRVLRALKREGPARVELESALAAASSQGAQPLVWRIQAILGRGPEAAVTLDAIARTLDDSLARDAFLERAAARLPAMPEEQTRRIAKQRFDGLTARERDVATLIAGGRSNRAIADTLVVSERTIETHVSHILAKLDFRSRAQIAAWAVHKGLVNTPM